MAENSHTRLIYCLLGTMPRQFETPDGTRVCATAEDAAKLAPLPDVFFINAQEPGFAESQLQSIRAHSQLYYKPVFLCGELYSEKAGLADGFAKDKEGMQKTLDAYLEHRASLGVIGAPTSPADRILFYLYLRPQASLAPLKVFAHPTLHHYPLVDALLATPTDGLGQADALRAQDFLHSAKLVGKQRECPRCNSPHLQFVDQCPRCASFNIDQQPFVHCFACGHVAPQDEYLSNNGLACPQCSVRLNQIGVDYDRPLEQGHCSDCGMLFSEPDVKAHCVPCGHVAAPEELRVRMIHELAIAPQGMVAVRAGGVDKVLSVQDQANLVSFAFFRHMLTWVIRLSLRYRETPFALASFSLQNTAVLESVHGFHGASRIVEDLLGRIQALFRNTDLMTRRTATGVLILLPQTPPEGCSVVRQRITSLLDSIEKNDHIVLPFRLQIIALPGELDEHATAESVIQTIEKENH